MDDFLEKKWNFFVYLNESLIPQVLKIHKLNFYFAIL